MAVSAGDYLPGARIIQGKKATGAGTGWNRGDVLHLDETNDVWKKAPAGTASAPTKGPFGVAKKDQADGDSICDVIDDGRVYVVTSGAIQPHNPVEISTTVAGQIQEYAPTAIAGTPGQADVIAARDEFRAPVGVYEGHEDEGDGKTAPTAAAANDVVRIKLTGGI